jgi:aryl-alcohol dehydrogenase-like predicted oxidoreductase
LLSIETLMDMMAQAVEAGEIRAVGVSNFNAKQMHRAATRLARYHIPLAANQVRYNLLQRQPEENGVLDACRELNVALVAYRPLERGQLKSNTVPGAPSDSPSTGEEGKTTPEEEILQETLKAIAQQRGKSVSQVALNWLLRKDERVIPIPGATKERHALENADTLNWKLSDDEFAAIDQASSPWKYSTGGESRQLLKDAVNLGVKRLFRGRS